MGSHRRRRAAAAAVLTLAVAIGAGVPAVIGAEGPAPAVDYRALWDRFPLDQQPAEPGATPAPAASAEDSSGGGPAPVAIGAGALLALGLAGAALVGVRRRRRRRASQSAAAAPSAPPPPAPEAQSAPAAPPRAAASATPGPAAAADPLYDDATCRAFAGGLSDEVLDRAVILFSSLAQQGRVDAARLSAALGARSSDLGGLLLTPLKRRADGMRLPLPYEVAQVPASRRRVWRDESGIARRMSQALRDEEDVRRAGADDDAGRLDLSALAERLREEPGAELVLSLADLERLIGDPLPEPVARRRWWSNRSESLGHPQATAWMTSGWRAYPELRQGRVRFRRAEAA